VQERASNNNREGAQLRFRLGRAGKPARWSGGGRAAPRRTLSSFCLFAALLNSPTDEKSEEEGGGMAKAE
jgi:hypothetical protein